MTDDFADLRKVLAECDSRGGDYSDVEYSVRIGLLQRLLAAYDARGREISGYKEIMELSDGPSAAQVAYVFLKSETKFYGTKWDFFGAEPRLAEVIRRARLDGAATQATTITRLREQIRACADEIKAWITKCYPDKPCLYRDNVVWKEAAAAREGNEAP